MDWKFACIYEGNDVYVWHKKWNHNISWEEVGTVVIIVAGFDFDFLNLFNEWLNVQSKISKLF